MNLFNIFKIKSKKGFSLTEVLVATAVIAVLMTAMAMLLSSAQGIFTSLRRDSQADAVTALLGDYIEGRLKTANEVYIYNINKDGNDESTSFSDMISDDAWYYDPVKYKNGIIIISSSGGRIYDNMNIVDSSGNVAGFIAEDKNIAFKDEFYNNCEYPVKIESIFGENSYLKITHTPMRNGERLSAERVKSFFLLNGRIINGGNYDPLDADPKYILIYYKRYKF
ncbi:MAG: type II secretion system GspH family protein [Eubacterium sp.]|jgi:prepilin-type N-terminal cleavage/methylation domain-containing protein|nr:type II secretion system GspH family protein [Eubacterium sp.]